MARIKPQVLLQQSKKKKSPSRFGILTIILYSLIVVVAVYFLYSTYIHWSQRSVIQTNGTLSGVEADVFRTDIAYLDHHINVFITDAAFCGCYHLCNTVTPQFEMIKGNGVAFIGSKKSNIPRYAILSTSKGLITVELYKDGSPEVVDEFITLCQSGHFKGMPFHRVIKNFVIQGGDSTEPGATEDWTTRGKHNNHLDTSLKHDAFMLGTSKVKPDKKGFKLFITTAPIPDLNEKLIVLGQVIKGEDVVQEIEEVDTDEHYQPKSPIGIVNISLKETV